MSKELEYAISNVEVEQILEKILDTVAYFVSILPRIAEFENMNTTEFYVFMYIATRKDSYSSQIALNLGLRRSSVSMILKKLLKKQLIEMTEDENDRRYVHIYLSKKGKDVFEKFLKAFESIMLNVISKLSYEDFEKLTSSFELISRFSQLIFKSR